MFTKIVAAVLFLCAALSVGACGSGDQAEPQQQPGNGSRATEEVTGQTVRPSPDAGEDTSQVGAAEVPSGGVGEAIPLAGVEVRVLDYLSTPEYSYIESAYSDGTWMGEEGIATAGKFVVVNYAVRNTGSAPTTTALTGMLETADGESYQEADAPKNPQSGYTGLELAPRELGIGQLIFDVPEDVEPVRLNLSVEDASGQPTGQGATVDLTRQDPQGPSPEEILALYYTYGNMGAYAQQYALFSYESKQRITEEQFVSYFESIYPSGTKDFSFPSVDVRGEEATVEIVRTDFDGEGEEQVQITQEMARQEEGWRVVAREDQVESLTAEPETTQY